MTTTFNPYELAGRQCRLAWPARADVPPPVVGGRGSEPNPHQHPFNCPALPPWVVYLQHYKEVDADQFGRAAFDPHYGLDEEVRKAAVAAPPTQLHLHPCICLSSFLPYLCYSVVVFVLWREGGGCISAARAAAAAATAVVPACCRSLPLLAP